MQILKSIEHISPSSGKAIPMDNASSANVAFSASTRFPWLRPQLLDVAPGGEYRADCRSMSKAIYHDFDVTTAKKQEIDAEMRTRQGLAKLDAAPADSLHMLPADSAMCDIEDAMVVSPGTFVIVALPTHRKSRKTGNLIPLSLPYIQRLDVPLSASIGSEIIDKVKYHRFKAAVHANPTRDDFMGGGCNEHTVRRHYSSLQGIRLVFDGVSSIVTIQWRHLNPHEIPHRIMMWGNPPMGHRRYDQIFATHKSSPARLDQLLDQCFEEKRGDRGSCWAFLNAWATHREPTLW